MMMFLMTLVQLGGGVPGAVVLLLILIAMGLLALWVLVRVISHAWHG